MKKFKIYIKEEYKKPNTKVNMTTYLLSQGVDEDEFLWWVLAKAFDKDIDAVKEQLGEELHGRALDVVKMISELAYNYIFELSEESYDDPEGFTNSLMDIYDVANKISRYGDDILNIYVFYYYGFDGVVNAYKSESHSMEKSSLN